MITRENWPIFAGVIFVFAAVLTWDWAFSPDGLCGLGVKEAPEPGQKALCVEFYANRYQQLLTGLAAVAVAVAVGWVAFRQLQLTNRQLEIAHAQRAAAEAQLRAADVQNAVSMAQYYLARQAELQAVIEAERIAWAAANSVRAILDYPRSSLEIFSVRNAVTRLGILN
jgi:hypothetical protein